jgi:hypothetical protein
LSYKPLVLSIVGQEVIKLNAAKWFSQEGSGSL